MSAAESRAGGEFLHTREKSRIGEALKSAKKDNDFIYHAIVPDVKSLPAIGKAVVAKPIPLAAPMSSRFTGKLLKRILPKQLSELFLKSGIQAMREVISFS